MRPAGGLLPFQHSGWEKSRAYQFFTRDKARWIAAKYR
jgi:hypothetical protein